MAYFRAPFLIPDTHVCVSPLELRDSALLMSASLQELGVQQVFMHSLVIVLVSQQPQSNSLSSTKLFSDTMHPFKRFTSPPTAQLLLFPVVLSPSADQMQSVPVSTVRCLV